MLSISPALTFPNVLAGTASAPQSVMVKNTGQRVVHLLGASFTGAGAADFSLGGSCPSTLAVGSSCTYTVTFTAAAAGSYTAALQVNADVPGNAVSVGVMGTAVTPTPAAALSGNSIHFATQTAGMASSASMVTLSNPGTAALAISGITLTGADANAFAQTSTCGSSLAVAASCSISVVWDPAIAGSYTASLAIADTASTSPQTVALSGASTPAAISINTAVPKDWKISNGAISLDWNSQRGNVFGVYLAGHSDNLVDTTSTDSAGQPNGLYMDNSGIGSGAITPHYDLNPNYLDFWISMPSSSTNAFSYEEHFLITPNDPGIHVYFVARHSATDIAGSLGQIQWVFRVNLAQYTSTYTVNGDLSNPGPTIVNLPPASENFSTDPGRAVQDATVDEHGFPPTPGYTRSFYTKYDYDGYEYLHKAHGLFGATYGVWAVLPSQESLVGGPTKQNLIYTGNLVIIEALSNHLDNGLPALYPSGTAATRLFGPFYIRFNAFGPALTAAANPIKTPEDMYADATGAISDVQPLYDNEPELLDAGYVPSTGRGSVQAQVSGVIGTAKTAWAVLSDDATNFQYSYAGKQYWQDISSDGTVNFTGVAPGTYRLSVYVLGQWGELRKDGIVVTSGGAASLGTLAFTPENFGTTLWTIGAPDRSSHEFLHGHDSAGHDDKEYWGNWNYWADFAVGQGAVNYNATSGPNGLATDDLTQWNYAHWGTFDPGLFGGFYQAADDTTDGYKYIAPSYLTSLTERTPAWNVQFVTPDNNTAPYVTLSVALSCAEGSYVVTLNGQQLVWHYKNASDCMIRSGLSGYTQWVVFEWPVSVLAAAGQDNLLTIGVSQNDGVEDDALRLELSPTTSNPAVRGWNDYEWVSGSSDTPANDTVANP